VEKQACEKAEGWKHLKSIDDLAGKEFFTHRRSELQLLQPLCTSHGPAAAVATKSASVMMEPRMLASRDAQAEQAHVKRGV
jgi:hypothetical protein